MRELICCQYDHTQQSLSKEFALFLSLFCGIVLGQHARDKDEDEAVAGEDDRVELRHGSELGGQGEKLNSCHTWCRQLK